MPDRGENQPVTGLGVSIEALCFTYPCGTKALDDVCLRVEPGKALGVVGPNGAGKSSLVQQLCGFSLPTSGGIRIGDVPVARGSLPLVRTLIGVVFQNADDQLFQPTALEDVAFGLRNTGMDVDEAERRARGILDTFGLSAVQSKAPYHLSSGQKRFVALCGVLVMDSRVLVLDEPTSDLDPRNRRVLTDTLNGLAMTRLVVSHDLDFVWDTCDEVAILDSGRLVAHGPSRQILRDGPLLRAHHLELPLRLQGIGIGDPIPDPAG